jgi:hypothetical protein
VKVDVPSATDVHAVRRLEVEYSSLAAPPLRRSDGGNGACQDLLGQ